MDVLKLEKEYQEYCKRKSTPGYVWGIFSCDVFEFLRERKLDSTNEMLYEIIRWENGSEQTSLEKVLKTKFNVFKIGESLDSTNEMITDIINMGVDLSEYLSIEPILKNKYLITKK